MRPSEALSPSRKAGEDPRVTLRRFGYHAQRSFSQNFLIQSKIVDQIVSATHLGEGDTVIEIGPGTGMLTSLLLAKGVRVIAIERDARMVRILRSDFSDHLAQKTLTVIEDDVLKVPLHTLGKNADALTVIGNLPYAITGPIIKALVELNRREDRLRRAVIMVQREVAQRLTATPGSKLWGALSCWVGVRFTVTETLRVSAGNFFPRPKVDSTVVSLNCRVPRLETPTSFEILVRAGFTSRRKTLRNALGPLLTTSKQPTTLLDEIFFQSKIDPHRRGETLHLSEWMDLARVFDRALLSW